MPLIVLRNLSTMTDISSEAWIVAYGCPVDDATHMTEYVLPACRLFVFVKTHPHLQYYLKLHDTRRAANQDRLRTAKVIKLRAASKSSRSPQPNASTTV
jgi:hypothetical protein